MKELTPQQRKALRDGYCAGLRNELPEENPYIMGTDIFNAWEYGRSNLPIVWRDDQTGEWGVKWICFKCGIKYSVESWHRDRPEAIWKELMIGHNFCKYCDHMNFPI